MTTKQINIERNFKPEEEASQELKLAMSVLHLMKERELTGQEAAESLALMAAMICDTFGIPQVTAKFKDAQVDVVYQERVEEDQH